MLYLQYIDYVGSWGPAIVGHAHPEVTEALHEQIKKVCPHFTALSTDVLPYFADIGFVPHARLRSERLCTSSRLNRAALASPHSQETTSPRLLCCIW